jgi:hypothetical protein
LACNSIENRQNPISKSKFIWLIRCENTIRKAWVFFGD